MIFSIVSTPFFEYSFTIIGLHYLIASAIGFLSGVCLGYFFNKRWTFGVQKGRALLGLYYVLVYTISLVLSLFFLEWLVVGWNMYPPLAKCIVIVFAVVVNFIGLKCWVFR